MFNKLLSWFRPTPPRREGRPAHMDRYLQSIVGGKQKRDLPEQTCPSCHSRINAGATIHGEQRATPHPNDLGLCYQCGAVLEFDRDFKLQLITDETWNDLPRDIQEELIKAQGQVTLPGIRAKTDNKSEGWKEDGDE